MEINSYEFWFRMFFYWNVSGFDGEIVLLAERQQKIVLRKGNILAYIGTGILFYLNLSLINSLVPYELLIKKVPVIL